LEAPGAPTLENYEVKTWFSFSEFAFSNSNLYRYSMADFYELLRRLVAVAMQADGVAVGLCTLNQVDP
jgi:hypothetical protein